MSSANYYYSLIERISGRSAESTVSMLGITDSNLRNHLVSLFSDEEHGTNFLSDPVFESTFPWERHIEKRMGQLSGKLLLPSLIRGMDEAGEHKFGKEWYPFKHQVKSWEILLGQEEKKSVVVTSGTGSGKTECFMVPILNDLIGEYETSRDPLIGTRALFIYPLNALINSQRERLRAWTKPFEDGVRFCLYNGNTEENKHTEQGKYPHELLTRKNIRIAPPPIMVTNATMLEYMLVRQVDAPIIEKSKGQLRWIVLDEAHTYIGSQAAELSLLLRRTLDAFGVDANNVRFVATSATMGDKAEEGKLQEYLANLAGISKEKVVVVGGVREVPELISSDSNNSSVAELCEVDKGNPLSNERYMKLSGNKAAVKLRQSLTSKKRPSTLTELTESIFGSSGKKKRDAALQLLDISSFTINPGPDEARPEVDSESFLPVRSHLFHQVISGLWCCSDKSCSHKKGTYLEEDWPFGNVYTQRQVQCECGAPIYELVFCTDCNDPHLMVAEKNGHLIQYDKDSLDEFSLDYEVSEGDEIEESIAPMHMGFITHRTLEGVTFPISINPETLTIEGMGSATIDINMVVESEGSGFCCARCSFEKKPHPFRQSLLGTPFYISNTVPTLLEACQESNSASSLPFRGRRLITFTDSRQGTARISTKIQQDSERDSIRGQVYQLTVAQKGDTQLSDSKKEKLVNYEEKINKFKTLEPELAQEYADLRDELLKEASTASARPYVKWTDLVNKLQASADISQWMYDYYAELNPEIFDASSGKNRLAQMILLREFARRPKRQNSLETLGLVSVCYPALDTLTKIPTEWGKLNFTLEDWKNFLKVALDFYVRENTILDIPDQWRSWMGARVFPKTVLNPQSDEARVSKILKWPQVVPGRRRSRLSRLIEITTNMDISNNTNIDIINNILQAAWKALTRETKILKPQSGSTLQFHLAREEMAFRATEQAWICPVTHRLIDTTLRGITPYLPFNVEHSIINCKKTNIEVCDIDTSEIRSEKQRKLAIRDWIANSTTVRQLRSENLWTDISDRIVEGGAFYRVAEHSAQQPAKRLQKYESLFKQGKLNILSCSTTMEMGVDIGGISVVAMNNVPPHPANYLQRAGRAGRRGETQAVAFTICKDNPHERSIFTNPLWPFTTAIPAPYIILNSAQIVQRHVNSLITAYFFKKVFPVSENTSVINLSCKWFFINEDIDNTPYKKMSRWLSELEVSHFPESLYLGIQKVAKKSVLSERTTLALVHETRNSLIKVGEKWLPKYQQLQNEIDKLEKISPNDPFKKKMEYDLKRYGQDYLLSELASNAFLPGYGFPTGIATFDHYSMHDFMRNIHKKSGNMGRIDNMARMRDRPGRGLSLAIREYAPGADIVLDGLVYKSAGILLNPFAPDEDFSIPVRMNREWRCHVCGCVDQATSSLFDEKCTDCGAELQAANIKEFIEPVGFSVDFYSTPTTDISTQTYIPVEEPWVTAREELKPLYNSLLGSYRASSEGHIFHHSSGANGNGYAVCLRCGRADSMTVENDYAKGLKPGVEHRRLQGKSGSEGTALCEGSNDHYAISKGLFLGSTDQTDVFELYLKNPVTNEYLPFHTNDSLAWTMAVVLRQALANVHGINAEEIGYTVKPTALPGSSAATAIALYDRCSGGAGFSSVAPHYIKELLLNAKKYLCCPDECGSACQSCLLGYDTRFHVSVLDRFSALEYLESIADFVELPESQKLFGEETLPCVDTLDREILRCADKGFDTLAIYLVGPADEWDIVLCGLKSRVISWKRKFKKVSIVLPLGLYSKLSVDIKQDFYLLESLGSVIEEARQETTLLAHIERQGSSISFASSEVGAGVPSNKFWRLQSEGLVSARDQSKPATNELDTQPLQVEPRQQGDTEIEVTNECDRVVKRFGEKLWSVMTEKCEKLDELLKSGSRIVDITYSDPYVCTPWSIMLFSEVILGLKQKLKLSWGNPVVNLITGDKEANLRAPGLYGEWNNKNTQIEIFKELFTLMGEELELDLKPIREMPHGRSLVINWNSGETTTIRFDHGMGFWSIDRRRTFISYDCNSSVEKQVERIISAKNVVVAKQGKPFPTQIFIKNRLLS
jgi:DEAD/DEAH box helicase domain-containing protein